MPRAAAALPLLALLLAGCLAPAPGAPAPPAALEPLTEATLGFGDFLALRVLAHDGVELHVDIQLPEGDGPFPAIIEYTPYSILGDERWAVERELGQPDASFPSSFYVPRGYAVGVAHVRGTGESGGCLSIGGPDEALDGAAIVEHLAAQPWSNGRVALMGTSYVGTTPLETMALNPPHLSTVVAISPVTEWYRYYFEHGEQRVNGDPPPGSSFTDPAFYGALAFPPGPRTGTTGGAEDIACWAEFTGEYYGQDDYDAYWQERNLRARVGNSTVPLLYAQGFLDENVATSMIPEFWPSVTAPKRAWLGQHAHGVPLSHEAFWGYVHRWLDHHLLGRANGAMDTPPVLVRDNLDRWRGEPTWPPPDAREVTLFLDPGTLTAAPPAEGQAGFRDDGRGEVAPPLEGQTFLRFETAPLDAPLHLAGEPWANLSLASDAADTQLSVLVLDVAPDGAERFVTRGYVDPRHRDGLEQGRDLVPGERYAIAWPLHPRDHLVEAGHRLAVIVKASDPYIVPDATRALNTLFYGVEGSRVTLPVVDDAGRVFTEEPPVP